MATYLDLDTWPRRPHFELFRRYESPFWDVCVNVDVTTLHARSQAPAGPSFFLATIYAATWAANRIEPFRYRLRGEQVLVHPQIHGSSTVLRPDQTFGFAYFPDQPSYELFAAHARPILERVKASRGLDDAADQLAQDLPADPSAPPATRRDDLLYFSVLPWLHFTSFQHARRADPNDSIPRLVFGRYQNQNGHLLMPVSLSLHHALADGYHAGLFFDQFQQKLENLDSPLT